MTLHDMIHYGIFAFLALVTIGSAIKVAATRRIIHAAYWLFPVFAGVAGFYLVLDAQFLAAIQVLIYIGAILVLIIFAVTVTRNANDGDNAQTNRFALPLVLAAQVLLVALIGSALISGWGPAIAKVDDLALTTGVPVTDVASIGVMLMQKYLLPFEIASVLLLAAMVGAIVMARKERPQAETTESVECSCDDPACELPEMAEV